METLDIANLQPGRRLLRAVFTAEGTLLFLPGEKLTPMHLAALREKNIPFVTVERMQPRRSEFASSSLPETPPLSDDLMAAVHAMLGERFQRHDMTNPHMRVIYEMAAERQSRALCGQEGTSNPAGKPGSRIQSARPPKANIRTLLAASHAIGTLPVVFQRLVTMINRPGASPEDIANIIAMDTVLSARLLKMVNSPFFGLRYKVDTILRAVVLVGTKQLLSLAMGTTLITVFRGLPVSSINMRSFWSHSLGCGVAARLLDKHAGTGQPETLFVSGLLHDIGRLLIYVQLPNHALYMLTEARRGAVSMHSLEREILGFTHEELGGELLRAWNCPDELTRKVAGHHEQMGRGADAENAILPVANMLVQALGYGSSGEVLVPPLAPAAWEKLRVSPENLRVLCGELAANIHELRDVFQGDEQGLQGLS